MALVVGLLGVWAYRVKGLGVLGISGLRFRVVGAGASGLKVPGVGPQSFAGLSLSEHKTVKAPKTLN